MATTKNITMKQFNGTDYDTLYPKTKVEQVENLTPSSIGAVSKTGDTMTGSLNIAGSNGTTSLIQYSGSTTIRNLKDSQNYADVAITGDGIPVFNAMISGNYYQYNILHTGNAQSLGFPKIAIGSYTGTGTYGANSPNTLNLGVVPKLVLIMSTTETTFTTGAEGGYANYGIFDPNITQMGAVRGSIHVSFSGTTLSWYADVKSNYYPETQQLNKSGVVYKWYVLY